VRPAIVGTVLDQLDRVAAETEAARPRGSMSCEPAGLLEPTSRFVIPAGSMIVEFPVADILDNAWNEQYFGVDSPEDEAAFDASVDAIGIRTPIILVGDNCALARGTLIGGRLRTGWARRRGQAFLPAILLHGLSADEILEHLIADNLAAARVRRLSPSQLFKLEAKRAELVARKQGQRSDLLGVQKGETTAIIAKELGQSPNSVKTRKAIFGSKVAPESIKRSVDAGKVSLAQGAKIVRELEKAHTSGASVEQCAEKAEAALHAATTAREKKGPRVPSNERSKVAGSGPSSIVHAEPSTTAKPSSMPVEETVRTTPTAPKPPGNAEICNSAFNTLARCVWNGLPADVARPKSLAIAQEILERAGRGLPAAYWNVLELLAEVVTSFAAIEQKSDDACVGGAS
jgi:hypothetical protein